MLQLQSGGTTLSDHFSSLAENLKALDDDQNSPVKRTNKILYVGILISLVVHFFLGHQLWYQSITEQENMYKPAIIFDIDFVDQKEALLEKIEVKDEQINEEQIQETPINEQEITETETIKEEIQPVEDEPLPAEKSNIDEPTTITPAQTTSKEIVLENIYDNIRETTTQAQPQSDFMRKDFIVMDPRLKQQLDKALAEQQRIKGLEEVGRIKRENEFHEFASQGGQKVVRVDGNCFQLQEGGAFSNFQYQWLLMGNCEKTEKLDFKTRKLDREYLEGNSQ